MLLSLAIFLPLMAALVILFIPARYKQAIKIVSLIGASLCFYVTLHVTGAFFSREPGETMDHFFDNKVEMTLSSLKVEEQNALRPILAAKNFAYPAKSVTLTEAEQKAIHGLKLDHVWQQLVEMKLASGVPQAKKMLMTEYYEWIPSFNIYYFVAVDGLSVSLVFLSALLGMLCIIYSWNIEKATKGFFSLFLLLISALMGVFLSLDFFLFYVFWEVVLLPMYFLIGIWGGPRRIYAAIKFFIYTLIGSVLMLVAMIALYYFSSPQTFNVISLMSLAPGFSHDFQWWIFLALFIGFAIKVPVFPFHTWLPDAHVEAPTPVSVILAGVLLKMGGYGFFRFNFPIAPSASQDPFFVWMLAILGVINIVYGAFCAMAQKDFKSLVAYSSISHMGYILLGMAAFTYASMQGAVLQMFNHGLSSALMFLLVGVVYERAHHRRIDDFGGIGLQMPYYTGIAMVGFFASLGLPGLNGFISEIMVFLGTYQGFSVAPNTDKMILLYIALSGIVLTAVYILWTIQRVYMGEVKNEHYKEFKDINAREAISMIPIAILCIVLGVFPKLILDVLQPSVDVIVDMMKMLGK
jgi:NADH-quinone oxidoreductase subunit M